MADWLFTDYSTGDNAHDGKDNVSLALSGADWYAATKTLVKTGAFADYEPAAGDVIHVSSATAGEEGWYSVSSKTSTSSLVLGDLLHGNGISSDQSDAATSSGPKKDINNALSAMAAGGHLWVRNTATYVVSGSSAIVPSIAGTDTAWCTVEGYGATIGDAGVAYVSCSYATYQWDLVSYKPADAKWRYRFLNIDTAGTTFSNNAVYAYGCSHVIWCNCRAGGVGTTVWNLDGADLFAIDCQSKASGGRAVQLGDRCLWLGGSMDLTSCTYAGAPIRFEGTGAGVERVTIYGASANQPVAAGASSGFNRFVFNTLDGGNVAGAIGVAQLVNDSFILAVGNIVANTPGPGINLSLSQGFRGWNLQYNCFAQNTEDTVGGAVADPEWADSANRDYRVKPTSPARRMVMAAGRTAGAVPFAGLGFPKVNEIGVQ